MINIVETKFEKHQNLLDFNLLFITKKFSYEYHDLVLKMHQDTDTINQVAHNLELLCDLELMLGLSCIMPMLEGFNELIKISHYW
jgi:hypothetical protein